MGNLRHYQNEAIDATCAALETARSALIVWDSAEDRAGKEHRTRWLSVMKDWSRRDVARREVVS